jgi:hypothetical protein
MRLLMTVLVIAGSSLSSQARSGNGRWQLLVASYEVPAPVDFARFANFQINDLRLRDRRTIQQMDYSIPRELTGNEVRIHVTSTDGGKTFKGPRAYMACAANDCNVTYPDLKINLAEVRAFLRSKGIQGEELAMREKVVGFFTGELLQEADVSVLGFTAGGDPGGIIHIKRVP